ncbi:L,D-transpeptidase family protein [Streptacidiphilus sp. EB103A]|uniref:L,D-transpeptidase family protein n=1 Tax=Streptacidiphilus sp. EB103A TaxID=3156275 RepID=UPI003511296B
MSSTPGRHARPRTPLMRWSAAASTTAVTLGAFAAATLLSTGTAQAATHDTAHTVTAGDTLSGIAALEHTPGGWPAIARLNHLTAPYLIHPGQSLLLPPGAVAGNGGMSFPVPVTLGNALQVITVKATGSYATVTAWQHQGHSWIPRYTTTQARVGANGITDGTTRHQGTDTTPTGTYTITQGFGVGANPGTKMPYHQVTSADWWVEDPQSPYYNQMRTAAQGGFPLTETGDLGSEHLINYPTQYHNALVINYNMNPAVPGRGAGIFLHDLGPQAGPTAGCVALPTTVITQIMQWINPAQHPIIAIG